ncbi:unnamed protein product [Anisakis simplex]|uniref:Uncharacterized protein n=1 Tax=Anisakis simplex TaxID=6269 RepID=A0A3P6S119_ANISI|nr:unnamed protein product [Anisakis simplex]
MKFGQTIDFAFQIWRHGDRSPTTTYPKDPNQESAWPLGWGQLTPVIFCISSKF